MTDPNRTREDMDIFEFLDIVISRKRVLFGFLFMALLASGVYCYLLRPEVAPSHSIAMTLRCPDRTDMLTVAGDAPENTPDLTTLAVNWIGVGAYRGAVQDRFHLPAAPELHAEVSPTGLKLLQLRMTYSDLAEGKRILMTVRELLKSSPTLKDVLTRERTKIAIEIQNERLNLKRVDEEIAHTRATADGAAKILEPNDAAGGKPETLPAQVRMLPESVRPGFENSVERMMKRLRQLQTQLLLSLKTQYALMDRLVVEREGRKTRLGILQQKIDTLEQTFDSEGPIYSDLILTERTANYQIIGVAGIVGIFFGIFIIFLSEVKKRIINNRERPTL